MSLHTRIAKLEGTSLGVPTAAELRDATELRQRYFRAIDAPEIFGPHWDAVDPDEQRLMQEAERSGQVAAAREVIRRYDRAHGRDDSHLSPEERVWRAMAQLDAAFAEPDAALGHGMTERLPFS